jgi:hypothetical protein
VLLKELVNTNKNTARFDSVMKVVKVNEDKSYDLEDGAGNFIKGRTIDQLKVLPIAGDILKDQYLVEKILDAGKDDNGSWVYKVRYLGYGPDEDRWIPHRDVGSETLKKFWQTKRMPVDKGGDGKGKIKSKKITEDKGTKAKEVPILEESKCAEAAVSEDPTLMSIDNPTEEEKVLKGFKKPKVSGRARVTTFKANAGKHYNSRRGR